MNETEGLAPEHRLLALDNVRGYPFRVTMNDDNTCTLEHHSGNSEIMELEEVATYDDVTIFVAGLDTMTSYMSVVYFAVSVDSTTGERKVSDSLRAGEVIADQKKICAFLEAPRHVQLSMLGH